MDKGIIHIIGAGLAGLSAAVTLAEQGFQIRVHELSRNAGGRCRSYFDPLLGMMIDNGNHLVLSSNYYTRNYLKKIQSEKLLPIPPYAIYSFFDVKKKTRWTLQLDDSFIPWWIFSKVGRVPGTKIFDYFKSLSLIIKPFFKDNPISKILNPREEIFQNLLNPVLLAALNTKLDVASSYLASKILLKTILRGGRACKPMISNHGLSSVFIDPAVEFLKSKMIDIHFNHELKSVLIKKDNVIQLLFNDECLELNNNDKVILAVPAWCAKKLVPLLSAPTEFSSIINLHYKINAPDTLPTILAVINGTAEWIFAFPDRISVTISAADELLDVEREDLANIIWEEIKLITGLEIKTPEWQIVKERRATFRATPEQNSLRPNARTALNNLFLAGDWTQTGYPSTIEGAILSGIKAAHLSIH